MTTTTPETEALVAQVEDLRQEVARLRRGLDAILAGSGTVRCRRLVVEDHHGVERVVVGCLEGDDATADAPSTAIQVRDAYGEGVCTLAVWGTDDGDISFWSGGNPALELGVSPTAGAYVQTVTDNGKRTTRHIGADA